MFYHGKCKLAKHFYKLSISHGTKKIVHIYPVVDVCVLDGLYEEALLHPHLEPLHQIEVCHTQVLH